MGSTQSSLSSTNPDLRRNKARRSTRRNTLISRKYEPKILIIGAGAAGLACAAKLIEHGFKDVLVLEAEFRVGGRIFTIPFADNVVDLGAQWVHGEKDNVIFELVKERNLLDTSTEIYEDFQCIRSNGEIVPDALVQRLKGVLADIFLNQRLTLATFEGSLDDFLSNHFFDYLREIDEYKDIDMEIATEFFENYKKFEGSESSSGIEDVSARGLLEYWVCEGDYMLNWKDKGFLELLRVLTKADVIGNELGVLEDKVQFGLIVDKIKWDRPDGKVEVRCANYEECFEADHAIVTCSLGVLKERCKTLFEPELPHWKQGAIEALGFGNVCKIYLEYALRFWPEQWNGFTTLWRQVDYTELVSTENAWMLDVFGFYRVKYQPRVLVAWIVGTCVKAVEELPKSVVIKGLQHLLRRFLKDWEIPEPLNVVVTDWNSNPNFRGAYSYRSMLTEVFGWNAFVLGQPLTGLVNDMSVIAIDETGMEVSNDSIRPRTVKPLVQFAGEATSEHYYSTAHGAVESGWREANRLKGYYLKDL